VPYELKAVAAVVPGNPKSLLIGDRCRSTATICPPLASSLLGHRTQDRFATTIPTTRTITIIPTILTAR